MSSVSCVWLSKLEQQCPQCQSWNGGRGTEWPGIDIHLARKGLDSPPEGKDKTLLRLLIVLVTPSQAIILGPLFCVLPPLSKCPFLFPDGFKSSLPVPPGFDLMVAFGLVAKEYASIRGVAMEPSALGEAPTFTLFKDAQLMRRAR